MSTFLLYTLGRQRGEKARRLTFAIPSNVVAYAWVGLGAAVSEMVVWGAPFARPVLNEKGKVRRGRSGKQGYRKCREDVLAVV